MESKDSSNTNASKPADSSDPTGVLQTIAKDKKASAFYNSIKTILTECDMTPFLWFFQGQNAKLQTACPKTGGICYALTVDWLGDCLQKKPKDILKKLVQDDTLKKYGLNQEEFQKRASLFQNNLEVLVNNMIKVKKEYENLKSLFNEINLIRDKNAKNNKASDTSELNKQFEILYSKINIKKINTDSLNIQIECNKLSETIQNRIAKSQEQFKALSQTKNNISSGIKQLNYDLYNKNKKITLTNYKYNEDISIKAFLNEMMNEVNPTETPYASKFSKMFIKNGIYHLIISFINGKINDTTHVIAIHKNDDLIFLLDANSGGFELEHFDEIVIFGTFLNKYLYIMQNYFTEMGYGLAELSSIISWTE